MPQPEKEEADLSRRNLMYLSVALAVLHFSNFDYEKAQLFGLGNGLEYKWVPLLSVWLVWGWFFWRFLQFHERPWGSFVQEWTTLRDWQMLDAKGRTLLMVAMEKKFNSLYTVDGNPTLQYAHPLNEGRFKYKDDMEFTVTIPKNTKSTEISTGKSQFLSSRKASLTCAEYLPLHRARLWHYLKKDTRFSTEQVPVMIAWLPVLGALSQLVSVLVPLAVVIIFMLYLFYKL